MTALTADRNTPSRSGDLVVLTVYGVAATTIYAGSLVCVTDAGRAVPGGHAQAARAIGRAEHSITNPLNGTQTITVRRGVFQFARNGLTAADIGRMAYVIDDQTVGAYDSGRVAAGQIVDVDSAGAWVAVGDAPIAAALAALTGVLTGTVDGGMENVAAAAGACAGGATPSATQVDAAIATAVAPLVTGTNLQLKELQTQLNAVIAALVAGSSSGG